MDDMRFYQKALERYPDFRVEPNIASVLVEQMKNGDEKAKLSLVESTLKYIAELAASYCRKWCVWPHYPDLVQEANTEIAEKIDRYDPALGHLKKYIEYLSGIAFLRFWHRATIVHRTDHGRKILSILRRAREELTARLGREPTLAELSEYTDREESDIAKLLNNVTVVEISEHAKEGEHNGKAANHNSILAEELDPFQNVAAAELRELLIECLGVAEADLLLTYFDSGTGGFRSLYLQIHRKPIGADAARKAKERMVKKLKDCLRKKGKLLAGGETL